MSRVSILEQLTAPKKKTALDFHYEDLWAPPIMSLFTPQDIQELVRIATSLRYAGNIARKYDMIDAVMKRRGFRRAHCGTNRVVYNFLEDDRFVAKVAVDRVGMEDSPAEYRNQAYFQPFCCKIFEVDPSGVISFIERVNPISSIEEFMSVKDDIFNMMVTKIIGKYIVDDLGTKAFMNFGIRMNANGTAFGPVIIDFPYAYELDGAKLRCAHKIVNEHGNLEECGGEIDYDPGFNTLICNKCGREYKALDLAKKNNSEDVKLVYSDAEKAFAKSIRYLVRGKIIDGDKVIYDSGRRSNRILLKEEFNSMNNASLPVGPVTVDKTIRKKNPGFKETKRRYYTDLQMQYYDKLVKAGMFNPVVEDDTMVSTVNEVVTPIKSEDSEVETPIMGKAVTVSSVIADGSIIYSSEDIETLEENTFPELNNTPVDVAPPFTTDSDSKDTSASVIMPSENLPDQIISDEEVRRMVIEVKAATSTNNDVVDINSSIVDPEKDKIPEISPITRPTSDPSNSVLYKEPKNTSTIHLGPVSAVYEEETYDDEGDDADIVKAITDAMVECSKSPSEEFRIGDDEEDLDTIDDYYDDAYDDTYDNYYDDARNKKHRNPMNY